MNIAVVVNFIIFQTRASFLLANSSRFPREKPAADGSRWPSYTKLLIKAGGICAEISSAMFSVTVESLT